MLTLDYFRTHPLRLPKDQAGLTINLVRSVEKASVHPTDMHPTAGAYIHYGGVELADMLAITQPTLTQADLDKMAKLWYASCGRVCKQLLFYVWNICSKEMRHGNLSKCDKAFEGWEPAFNEPGMVAAIHLCKMISSGGSSYPDLLDNSHNTPVGPYMKAVERQFRKGGWGGAYGGPKWADITLEMVRYFYGETSAMIAADRLWAAVHNTGPIFNKGFYFKVHDHRLMAVLNAQAASSVFSLGSPKMFLNGNKGAYGHEVSDAFTEFAYMALKAIQTVNPDYEFGAGGSVGSDGTKSSMTGKGDIVRLGPITYTTADREAS